ncbi:hypothetical protein ACLI4Y_16005 [Natrialbaceae archaeon A-CW3]
MIYPHGACQACGERVYTHIDGGNVCHNCGARELGDDDGGKSKTLSVPQADENAERNRRRLQSPPSM